MRRTATENEQGSGSQERNAMAPFDERRPFIALRGCQRPSELRSINQVIRATVA